MAENPAYKEVSVGVGSYGQPTILSWDEGTKLTIGNYCSIADGVTIFLGGEHRTDWVTTYPFSVLWKSAKSISGHPRSRGDVTIGHDVWIGRNATILSGVTIGDGAVIGTGSIVTCNVQPYMIVAGNPAREIRPRFDRQTIDALRHIKWWDWPNEQIELFIPKLLSPDLPGFIRSVETTEKVQTF